MSVRIRRAALESDQASLIDLVRRHLTPRSNAERFRWLYCDSPHGVARAWLACAADSGAAVGVAAAFPRRVCLDGKEKRCWVLGDFCLDEKYRSLGPALQLQRACLEVVTEYPDEFCYDFPSQSMMTVYRRLDIQSTGTLVRWAMPLRAEGKLESVVRSKIIARGLSPVVNFALKRRGWKGQQRACDVTLHQGVCGEEISALDRELRQSCGIRTVRTAEYLNWRYLAQPAVTHEILTARRKDQLLGYIVLTCDGGSQKDAYIVDLCSREEPAVIARLLADALETFRQRGVATVNLCSGDTHPWNALFERCGFRRREASSVVVCGAKQGHPSTFRMPANWYLMQGDRDS